MGNEGPEKFFNDGKFCIWTQLMIVITALTLGGIASRADHGGSSEIPFFISGFILSIFHIVNLSLKIYVLFIIKTVSKKAILEVLRKRIAGKYLWPISAQIGMVWTVPGMIITGLGGLNCDVEFDKSKNATSTPRNDCYYSIYDRDANIYKGMAIGLMVCHGVSLVWFLFSAFPEKGVLDQIKDDPKPKSAAKPASQNNSPKPENESPKPKTPSAPKPQNNEANPQGGACGSTPQSEQLSAKLLAQREKEIELREKTLALQERAYQLDQRERELERRERELRSGFVSVPPPPSYEALSGVTVHEAPDERKMPPVDGDC